MHTKTWNPQWTLTYIFLWFGSRHHWEKNVWWRFCCYYSNDNFDFESATSCLMASRFYSKVDGQRRMEISNLGNANYIAWVDGASAGWRLTPQVARDRSILKFFYNTSCSCLLQSTQIDQGSDHAEATILRGCRLALSRRYQWYDNHYLSMVWLDEQAAGRSAGGAAEEERRRRRGLQDAWRPKQIWFLRFFHSYLPNRGN